MCVRTNILIKKKNNNNNNKSQKAKETKEEKIISVERMLLSDVISTRSI